MKRQRKTLAKMDKRVNEINENFDSFTKHFDKRHIFSGPSVYFHKKVMGILREEGLSKAFKNELFFEYLYATLASWGLHRMGETNTKLVDFDKFKKSIALQKRRFLALERYKITELNCCTSVTKELKILMQKLKIGKGETKIVFNSKTMHHLLPDLMPPIDRQYTLLFFYNSTSPPNIDRCFSEIYPMFISIALCRKNSIRKMSSEGYHPGETKVIDNAIVGYVLKKGLKQQKTKARRSRRNT